VESLRGQLLVASPALLDPNFHRTVVLVVDHGDEGAVGLVLNRRSQAEVSEAVPPLADLVEPEDQVHVGGPVEQQAVIVIAELEDPSEAATLVFADVGLVSSDSEPELVAGSTRRARVFAGYAGWGAGQLESEIEEEAWIVEQAEPDDVFAEIPDELWADVLRRKGGQYALLARMPPDPSVN
jgi:putative transcriptional regulator